uniref:Secreted protein n=1 Tax=Nothoprocta perdicaria TaxID=30464 RepID=A0A8C7EF96_NOTPE
MPAGARAAARGAECAAQTQLCALLLLLQPNRAEPGRAAPPRPGRRVTRRSPSPCRLDFAHMFPLYKPRRGLKRGDDSKVSAAGLPGDPARPLIILAFRHLFGKRLEPRAGMGRAAACRQPPRELRVCIMHGPGPKIIRSDARFFASFFLFFF